MVRIKLIVTGDMEQGSIHHSLKRCFPNHRNGEPVEWDLPRKLNCATSNRLDSFIRRGMFIVTNFFFETCNWSVG